MPMKKEKRGINNTKTVYIPRLRDGKVTPCKSELAMSCNGLRTSQLTGSQHANLSSKQQAASFFSQASTHKNFMNSIKNGIYQSKSTVRLVDSFKTSKILCFSQFSNLFKSELDCLL